MSCRIGITADLERRKKEWQREYPTWKRWTILEKHSTKAEAQAAETRLAKHHGCQAYRGGREPEFTDLWYVYRFEFDE